MSSIDEFIEKFVNVKILIVTIIIKTIIVIFYIRKINKQKKDLEDENNAMKLKLCKCKCPE